MKSVGDDVTKSLHNGGRSVCVSVELVYGIASETRPVGVIYRRLWEISEGNWIEDPVVLLTNF